MHQRQKLEDALFAVSFTEKSADGRQSQNVSLLTEAKHFLAQAKPTEGFGFVESETKMSEGRTAGANVRFPAKTGHS